MKRLEFVKNLGIGVLGTAASLFLVKTYKEQQHTGPYYIDPKGSDDNPGTKAKPFKSLDKGIRMAKKGDDVYINGSLRHIVKRNDTYRIG